MQDSGFFKDLDSFASGQEFIRLYVQHERRIYGFIYSLIHDWSTSEDLLQETALVLWRKFPEFEAGTSFLAWSLRIARYQVANYCRTKGSAKSFNSELLATISDESQAYVQKEGDRRHEALKGCLKKLPARDKKIITARYEVGTTVATLAKDLGIHPKSLYRSLKRIRNQLFMCMKQTLAIAERS